MCFKATQRKDTIILPEDEIGKAFSSEDNEYGNNYHGKSFSIMSMPIDIIGKNCYFSIMKHILKYYGGKVLYTLDL